jgi:hypothetical protein
MSTVAKLPLSPGQRLSQAEFHRRYEQCPPGVKFELIGGVVHMHSPLRRPHGSTHPELSGAFFVYKARTPGIEILHDTTTILGEQSEPQPDLALRALEEYGGRSWENATRYLEGPPELLAEVAHSSRALDLGAKRTDYRAAGVLEYLVACVEEQEVRWFDFRDDSEIRARQGVFKSRAFPGLWLDAAALFAHDAARLIEIVQQGLASKGHAAFVKRLEAARRRKGGQSP